MIKDIVHYNHEFHSIEDCSFSTKEYSQLKFGNKTIAKKFGEQLADSFYEAHVEQLLSDDCVVISSPYNYVKNAATIMTESFIPRLNSLLVAACGKNVEYTTIHRKVSYTADYGFLSKDKRKNLLNNDEFYINKDFVKDKTCIFIDDVKITGTHEEKLKDIMDSNGLSYDRGHFYLYYANYTGNQPDIEAKLNFASVGTLAEVIDTVNSDNSELIIRPIKYLMSRDFAEFKDIVKHKICTHKLYELYNACLAEGYYKIPLYQNNFNYLRETLYK